MNTRRYPGGGVAEPGILLSMRSTAKQPSAAGAVVIRGDTTAPDVLMVRSGPGGGWRLPMDLVAPDEYLASCAARAARTDARLGIRLGVPIAVGTLPKSGSPVAWWRARTTTPDIPSAGNGIDHVAWIPADEAVARTADTGQDRVIRGGDCSARH